MALREAYDNFIIGLVLPWTMPKCNYCGEPLFLPIGTEHLKCAARHPRLALFGWGCFFLGYIYPYARKREEELKQKIARMGRKDKRRER